LDSENTSMPTSFAPGVARNDGARYPSKAISEYALSCTTRISYERAKSTTRSKKPSGTTAPVGLFG
jgi:hypothetical protein